MAAAALQTPESVIDVEDFETPTTPPPKKRSKFIEPRLDAQDELLKASNNTLCMFRNKLHSHTLALKRGGASLDAVMNNFHTIQTLFGIGGVSFHKVEDKVKEFNALRARLECVIKATRDPLCDLCELNDKFDISSFCTQKVNCCGKSLCSMCIAKLNIHTCVPHQDATVSETGLRLEFVIKCPFCNSESLKSKKYVSHMDFTTTFFGEESDDENDDV